MSMHSGYSGGPNLLSTASITASESDTTGSGCYDAVAPFPVTDASSAQHYEYVAIARREFQYNQRVYASPSGSIVITFNSPDAHRLQLRTRFIENWLPRVHVEGIDCAFEYANGLLHSCPALAVIMDSSSLCEVGQYYRDIRLVKAGQALYGRALHLLRCDLASPEDRRNQALVVAIGALQISEAFTCLQMGDSWLERSKDMAEVYESQAERTLSSRGFQAIMGTNFYLFHFWAGLITPRRVVFFGDGGICRALENISQTVTEALMAADAFCVTPTLLAGKCSLLLNPVCFYSILVILLITLGLLLFFECDYWIIHYYY